MTTWEHSNFAPESKCRINALDMERGTRGFPMDTLLTAARSTRSAAEETSP